MLQEKSSFAFAARASVNAPLRIAALGAMPIRWPLDLDDEFLHLQKLLQKLLLFYIIVVSRVLALCRNLKLCAFIRLDRIAIYIVVLFF
jgi:hypothetical protein